MQVARAIRPFGVASSATPSPDGNNPIQKRAWAAPQEPVTESSTTPIRIQSIRPEAAERLSLMFGRTDELLDDDRCNVPERVV